MVRYIRIDCGPFVSLRPISCSKTFCNELYKFYRMLYLPISNSDSRTLSKEGLSAGCCDQHVEIKDTRCLFAAVGNIGRFPSFTALRISNK